MNLTNEQAKQIGCYIEEELSLLKTNKDKASFLVRMLSKIFSIKTLLESDCETAFNQLVQERKPISLDNLSKKLSLILNKKRHEHWSIICFQIKILSPSSEPHNFTSTSIEAGVHQLEGVIKKLSYN